MPSIHQAQGILTVNKYIPGPKELQVYLQRTIFLNFVYSDINYFIKQTFLKHMLHVSYCPRTQVPLGLVAINRTQWLPKRRFHSEEDRNP